MNKIIFIEGVSGVGKTTAASSMQHKLQGRGNAVVCFLEGDHENPLDPFGGTYPPAIPLEEFTDKYVDCWRRFMEDPSMQEKQWVFDGTLLHHQINDLIRNYNASDEVILTHLTPLFRIIQPMNPIVFYLCSRDVGQRLVQARKSRGETAATQDQIAFWENRKQTALSILESGLIESRILNIDDGWDLALEIITQSVTA